MKYLFCIFAYLLGSVPAGYVIFRLARKKDIRGYGSKNIGATNVLRVTGWKLALPVAVFDILKGAIPVYLAVRLFPEPWVAYAAGFSAILGHCFPIYIRFKGGKGVATTVGVFSVLALLPLLCILGVFVLVVALSRYVSMGSLTAAFSLPFFLFLFGHDSGKILLAAGVFLLIVFRHRKNIGHLIRGSERKLGRDKYL